MFKTFVLLASFVCFALQVEAHNTSRLSTKHASILVDAPARELLNFSGFNHFESMNKTGIADVFSMKIGVKKNLKTDHKIPVMEQNKVENLKEPLKSMVENIQWYGQSSVRILYKGKFIYIDPFQITDKEKADFVLITHSHFDHFSIEEINKIANHTTSIYAPKECCDKLRKEGFLKCFEVVPGQSFTVDGIGFSTVPAYNTVKNHHPKSMRWVGYVLNLNGLKIYHPGDTNRIPEMKSITCDIAFMPLGQTYTMENVEEAAEAVLDVKAKVAIPIHYGMYEGAEKNALQFKELLKNKVITVIKEPKSKLQPMH